MCDSVEKPRWYSWFMRHGKALRFWPMRKNDTGMLYCGSIDSRYGVKMLGPSSNVSAYVSASTHDVMSVVSWHGPQSSGQLPHVCSVQVHRYQYVLRRLIIGFVQSAVPCAQQLGKGDDTPLRRLCRTLRTLRCRRWSLVLPARARLMDPVTLLLGTGTPLCLGRGRTCLQGPRT